ncbi:Cytochrome b5 domain-containing protein 1 [Papilio machaon]|uniref:Cytochrome b5 domain-containing protein 1 n=1 Tax=Papilio machaon TaxID=76193 RepID=A0A194RSS0_PAPMA|nr:Cytochrome b5 domain-containing protein 1 [Papilio machaon]
MIYTKQEYYTPAEVVIHNRADDCWVSLNGKVLNMTSWLDKQFRYCKCPKDCSCPNKNWYCADDCIEYCKCFKMGFEYCDAKRLAMTILAYAGKDVSHWFKAEDWITYVHPIVGSRIPFMRHGPSFEQPVVPSTRWRPIDKPWWLDDSIVVGKLTARSRPIRITNTLTSSSVMLEVCSEETIYQIMMRYLPHNAHMHSYTWCHLGKPLKYHRTLEQNKVYDERDRFSEVALPENIYVPDILLYYNDDLTEDLPRDGCVCFNRECVSKPDQCKNK